MILPVIPGGSSVAVALPIVSPVTNGWLTSPPPVMPMAGQLLVRLLTLPIVPPPGLPMTVSDPVALPVVQQPIDIPPPPMFVTGPAKLRLVIPEVVDEPGKVTFSTAQLI